MILIPARLASTRFPRKIVQEILGIPMIVRVAKRAMEVDSTVVASDSLEVVEICRHHGIEAILTSKDHASGTDRIAEAARILELPPHEVILNVQGDEPFLEPEVIASLKEKMQEASLGDAPPFMASAYKKISQEEASDPNLVKVVLDNHSCALYFSRSPIPFWRDCTESTPLFYRGHLGLYAYTGSSLQAFCALPSSPLEEIEKLEQLRALSHGHKILMIEVETRSFGIDTPQDLNRALKIFGDS
ncbi:3-deoxy-manno-octulosonate cytidylyltransferase [Wolinella succinogenes]|uniref:3-deoxy-manno-octulosonate cytidylyltransferase n=1 Tax=Wolinella succinogenes TaxID=844 RepID=UPI00240A0EDD|nr:3-deoxy-manno-octulosonate cytidylyltransferase [Wolinella succinogenes]